MRENRETALAAILHLEGGYDERPTEGGGAVNHGITFTVFQAWRRLKAGQEVTFADLKDMTKEEAVEIYTEQFLAPIHFDELPAGVDYVMLDMAVIGGPTGATRILQKALGLKVDGHFGLVTRWAANHRVILDLINRISDVRLETYPKFKNWSVVAVPTTGRTWGEIWTSRIAAVRKRALALAAISPPPAPVEAPKPAPAPELPKPLAPAIIAPKLVYAPKVVKYGGIELEIQKFSAAEFLIFTEEIASKRMGTWRPRGIVLHCTAQPDLKTWDEDKTVRGIDEAQRIANMMPRLAASGFKASPHLFIDREDIITATPLWKKGTHAKSFNASYWGIEQVGDFTRETQPDSERDLVVTACACLFAMVGKEPTAETLKYHREEPNTSKPCPGNIGPKDWWITAITRRLGELFPGEHF